MRSINIATGFHSPTPPQSPMQSVALQLLFVAFSAVVAWAAIRS